MLGFVSALCGVAGFESMKKAPSRASEGERRQLNLEALQRGTAYGLALKGGVGKAASARARSPPAGRG